MYRCDMCSKRGKQYLSRVEQTLQPDQVKQQSYEKSECPEGMINLGISQSTLVFDLVEKKLKEPECFTLKEHDTGYVEDHGKRSFRLELSRLFDHYMKPVNPIDPDNLAVICGVRPLISILAFALGEPGDGFLVPAPCFYRFDHDSLYLGINLCPVYLSSQSEDNKTPFELSVAKLEDGLKQAQKKGITVRALLITNPDNPIGRVYSEEQMREFFKFAKRHSLHVIVDEIYLLSIFGDATFKSTLSMDDLPLEKEYIHVLWGFSKSFGMSGFHCGVIHTYNTEVYKVLTYVAAVHSTSTLLQNMLTHFIKDKVWLDQVFLPTHMKRLRECYSCISQYLDDLSIPFVECNAGFFVWVNLSKFMASFTKEGEMELFQRLKLEAKVKINMGSLFFCNEFGWFRIIFSVDMEMLKIGLDRMKTVLLQIQDEISGKKIPEGCAGDLHSKEEKTNEQVVSLEDMLAVLSTQIRTSDWLEENSAEKWVKENPDIAPVFLNKS